MGYRARDPRGAAWSATSAPVARHFTAQGDGANLSLLLIGADRWTAEPAGHAEGAAEPTDPAADGADVRRAQALSSVVAPRWTGTDALTGFGHETHLERFGPSGYGTDRNSWRRAARTAWSAS